jgi:hypothetical protein
MSDVSLPDGFFGSPDDDPLLQDDPLADASGPERDPPDDADAKAGSGAASGGATSAGETSGGDHAAGETAVGDTDAGDTDARETAAGETAAGEPGGRPQPAPWAGTPLDSASSVRADGPTTAATPGGTDAPSEREEAAGRAGEEGTGVVPASLFRQVVPSGDPQAEGLDEAETTELDIPAREAANGHLAPLRIALSQGWHLTRARVTSPGPDDEKNLALTFTLKRREG